MAPAAAIEAVAPNWRYPGAMWSFPLLVLACTSSSKDSASTESAPDTTDSSGPTDSGPTDSGPTDSDPTSDTRIEPGEICPLTERIGEITLFDYGGGAPYLFGQVYDAVDPWIGPAELESGGCSFHRFAPQSCGTCPGTQVCAFDGQCVEQRHARLDLSASIDAGSGPLPFSADPVTGQVYGELPQADTYTLTFNLGSSEFSLPAMTRGVTRPNMRVTATGDSMTPGDLQAAWTPLGDNARVRTLISINHHAAGPTFTRCDVPESEGSFSATSAMLVPLAVSTGLEFQGLETTQSTAVWTGQGCVDVRVGTQQYTSIEWAL